MREMSARILDETGETEQRLELGKVRRGQLDVHFVEAAVPSFLGLRVATFTSKF
jgi:hypothetical protein